MALLVIINVKFYSQTKIFGLVQIHIKINCAS